MTVILLFAGFGSSRFAIGVPSPNYLFFGLANCFGKRGIAVGSFLRKPIAACSITEARTVLTVVAANPTAASQCENIEIPTSPQLPFNEIEECERIVSEMPNAPTIKHGAPYAAYSPVTDVVKIPARERFDSAEDFYSTMFHELSHASGSLLRLNRPGITKHLEFGSECYSEEELIAELSSAFLCAKAGIVANTIHNFASYISGWLKALRNDKRMIVLAAGQAQRATDYILGVQPQPIE